jgi:hypothetical protein
MKSLLPLFHRGEIFIAPISLGRSAFNRDYLNQPINHSTYSPLLILASWLLSPQAFYYELSAMSRRESA